MPLSVYSVGEMLSPAEQLDANCLAVIYNGNTENPCCYCVSNSTGLSEYMGIRRSMNVRSAIDGSDIYLRSRIRYGGRLYAESDG